MAKIQKLIISIVQTTTVSSLNPTQTALVFLDRILASSSSSDSKFWLLCDRNAS